MKNKRSKSRRSTRITTTEPKKTIAQYAPDQGVIAEQLLIELESIAYDENLLEKTRTQWQFGDWDSLIKLDINSLQHHPDRAKLALLAAAGHYHTQNNIATRECLQLAESWGCSKKLIIQTLISGAHNTLGRIAAVSGDIPKAIEHYETALDIGSPHSDKLLKQVRISLQMQQLNILIPVYLAICNK